MPSRLSLQCIYGNSCTWAHDVRWCDICTSCAQVHELPESHCGDNRGHIVFMIAYYFIGKNPPLAHLFYWSPFSLIFFHQFTFDLEGRIWIVSQCKYAAMDCVILNFRINFNEHLESPTNNSLRYVPLTITKPFQSWKIYLMKFSFRRNQWGECRVVQLEVRGKLI